MFHFFNYSSSRRRTLARLAQPLTTLVSVVVAGCVSGPPGRVGGAAAAPPTPAWQWRGARGTDAALTPAQRVAAVGADSLLPNRVTSAPLSLTDVVDVALAHNPLTRAAWAQARLAAAAYGSERGRYFPALTVDVVDGPSKVISANPALLNPRRTTLTATGTLSLLLFDFGGRSGSVDAARQALFAADFTHNATLQEVALSAELAAFQYQTARGLLDASQSTVRTAQANLAAAERRHDVGLATIADVLQARTALAQAQLVAQGAEGDAQGARAALSAVLGVSATLPFELAADSTTPKVTMVAESVDSLIAQAERERPDLAAARALVRVAQAQARSAASANFPSVSLGANRGRSLGNSSRLDGVTYSVGFALSIPLFNGLSRQYDAIAAREGIKVAAARAEQARLLAAAQVYASYYALRTAAQRVSTAAELLQSAAQSEDVARGRYAEGVGSILDLLTAQNALADARAQTVQARWAWSAALAQLSHDVGALGPRGAAALPLQPQSSPPSNQ